MKPTRPSGARARVGVISLGCAKNLVDTEVMSGHLDRAGCEFVSDPAEAEIVIVNTCSFIEAAREESVQTILEAAEYKKSGRLQKLVVAGCMVQRHGEELRANLPEVDAFVGLDELDRIVSRSGLGGSAPELPVVPAARGPARYLYDDSTPRRRATPAWSAYVKIAEGCNHSCSFCAIPGFRGRFRSRAPESILREAHALARDGVREINLIAQDSSHYGRDLGLGDGLPCLLAELDRVEPLLWVRLHYLYPNTVTDSLIETMAGARRVLHYVDLPLQHAHPETLLRMRRGGSAASHLDLLGRFRRAMPDAVTRTTFIVGFPGETDEEFEALLDFVDEAQLDHVGAFTYSHEDGTSAARLDDDVPREMKEERLRRLMERQQTVAFRRLERFVGREVELIVEGAHPETDHLLVGRSWHQAPDVDGQVLINEGFALPGEVVKATISERAGYDLVGAVRGRMR